MLPSTLFDDDQVPEGKGDAGSIDVDRGVVEEPIMPNAQLPCDFRVRSGTLLKWDPYGRDGPRKYEPPKEWSVEPLAKYIRGVVRQIESNMQNHGVPTAEMMEKFVTRLMVATQRQVKRAPKGKRKALQVLMQRRLRQGQPWATNPEELKVTLSYLIEDLYREFPRGDATVLGQS